MDHNLWYVIDGSFFNRCTTTQTKGNLIMVRSGMQKQSSKMTNISARNQ